VEDALVGVASSSVPRKPPPRPAAVESELGHTLPRAEFGLLLSPTEDLTPVFPLDDLVECSKVLIGSAGDRQNFRT
jgi:hypothetical protein